MSPQVVVLFDRNNNPSNMERRKFLSLSGVASAVAIARYIRNSARKNVDTPWNKSRGLLHRDSHLRQFDVSSDSLQVHTINVGPADSTLIVTPSGDKIVVDTGHQMDGARYPTRYLEDHNINYIDLLIFTHPHWDHIGGSRNFIQEYNGSIGKIIKSGYTNDTTTFDIYKNALKSAESEVVNVRNLDQIDLPNENLNIQILNPQDEDIDGRNLLNSNCIVIRLEYKNDSYLLTSDSEKKTEDTMLNKYGDSLESDIMRAGHHGSNTSSGPEFLDTVDPELSVISSAYESKWGRPHRAVLERLGDRQIDTLWTAVHGSIISESNGSGWKVYFQRDRSVRPMELEDEEKIPINPSSGYDLETKLDYT